MANRDSYLIDIIVGLPVFLLDTNCVNARQTNDALNQLGVFESQGQLQLIYPKPASIEASRGAGIRKEKVDKFPEYDFDQSDFPLDHIENDLRDIVFPNKILTSNDFADPRILAYAQTMKYPLITTDGASKSQPRGILGSKLELRKFGLLVVTPFQALSSMTTYVTSGKWPYQNWYDDDLDRDQSIDIVP